MPLISYLRTKFGIPLRTKRLLILLSIFSCYWASAQTIQGLVLDSSGPVPYANVRFVNASGGTLTNLDGRFSINVADKQGDTLAISMLGYKMYRRAIASVKSELKVTLEVETYDLEAFTVLPKPAQYYVGLAMDRIPQNFKHGAENVRYFYREQIKENNNYLSFTEAIMDSYMPGYPAEVDDSIQIKLLCSRYAQDPQEVQFMSKFSNKQDAKELKKLRKKKRKDKLTEREEKRLWRLENPELDTASFNFWNPVKMLDSNRIEKIFHFFSDTSINNYDFWFEPSMKYMGYNILTIAFEQKKKIKKPLYTGKIFLEENSLSIVSLEYGLSEKGKKHIVPAKIKALMWIIGVKIREPDIQISLRSEPYGDHWAIEHMFLKGNTSLTKRHLFSANEHSDFAGEMVLMTLDRQGENPRYIPKKERLNLNRPFHRQLQQDYTNPLWKEYDLVIPEKLSDKEN